MYGFLVSVVIPIACGYLGSTVITVMKIIFKTEVISIKIIVIVCFGGNS
jgi:hypothetical protein